MSRPRTDHFHERDASDSSFSDFMITYTLTSIDESFISPGPKETSPALGYQKGTMKYCTLRGFEFLLGE
ncbi:uncharacterized protein DFL_007432 [Arthrobotrys flagrans]|uniref:Uncharacterized protein n=1 Tax=Arthrobotrys flagrans TaxID=97331 RepID=A0A436ZVN5_ARTFL|nr:hypothetical protein DFL_007432 [Arthrobotrys flagrans]